MCPIFRQNVAVRGLFLSLVVWLLGAACVEAQAGVLLFERSSLRPGLCAALRIQLSGSAEVRCLSDGPASGLADRLNGARARVRAEQASLGVLLERDADPRLVRTYLVSAQGEQATLAIERIEDRPEPDVDRGIALKVRDAYEVIGFVERELPKQQASAAAVLAKPPLPPSSTAGRPPTEAPVQGMQVVPATEPFTHAFVELAGGLRLGDALLGVGSAQLGVGRVSARLRYEFGIGARLSSRQHEQRAARTIRLVERGPLLSARLTFRTGRVELGGALQLYLALVEAEAEGIRGRKNVMSAVLGLGPDLRVRLFRLAYVRFAPSVELAMPPQRFRVNGLTVIDGRLVGASLMLGLLISLPVQATSEGFQP
jgi:hypothetical protein